MEVLEALNELIMNLLNLLGSWGALLGCVFILFESIVPILPLSVFITLNFLTFGSIIGFIISWVFTVLGCMMSYYIFKSSVSEKRLEKFKENQTLLKVINVIENMNFTSLALLISIPFTPAFAVNIAAGICRVDKKKFLYAFSRCICTFASARESTSFKNGYAFLYIAGVFRSIFFDASYSRILSFNI